MEARGYTLFFGYAGVEGELVGAGSEGAAVVLLAREREAPHDAEGLRGTLSCTVSGLLRSRDCHRES